MSATTAEKIYRDAIVIDGLNVSRWDSAAVYDSLHAGGVTAINATIAVWEGYERTLDNIASWLRRFREHADLIQQAGSVEDVRRAKAEGRTAVVFGWQNASPIGNDLDRLAVFHALGVRIVQVTYNERNLLGNGCFERTDDGLSNFGLDAVREMNRLGILIDLSHVGDRTTMDTIESSNSPVAFTHANARSFFDHPRNKPDDALRALAERGGVVGANAFPIHPQDRLRVDGEGLRRLDRRPGREGRNRPRGHRHRLLPRTSRTPSSSGFSRGRASGPWSGPSRSRIPTTIPRGWRRRTRCPTWRSN